MKKNDILKSIKVIVLGLVLGLGISYVYATVGNTQSVSSNWAIPSGTPPAGNVVGPIDMSNKEQAKGGTPITGSLLNIEGTLSSDSLAVFGNSVVGGDLKASQLSGVGSRPICVDSSGKLIPC
ncbi:MAG: hypothetical protein WA101_01310 [Minisyncoccia bacterium]